MNTIQDSEKLIKIDEEEENVILNTGPVIPIGMNMDIGQDEDDDFTDIREQIFHNTVREQIVSNKNNHVDMFENETQSKRQKKSGSSSSSNEPMQINRQSKTI